MRFPLRNGEQWELPPTFEQELNEHFHDVQQELAKARLWLVANPHRQKTAIGMRRYCLNWLNRAGKLRPSLAKPVSIVRTEQPVNREAGKEKLAALKAMIHR